MARTPIWKSIFEALRDELVAGHYLPGDKLPTEAALSKRFDANRHTVRQALRALADAGLTHSRQGAGVFVTARPTEYPIGRRVRFHQNVLAQGQTPEKEVLRLETRLSGEAEAEALGIEPGAPVHVYEGISYADRAPVAVATSVFPASRLPGLLDALRESTSITAALKAVGVGDYTRASTRITAVPANAGDARHLRVREGAPILRSVALNIDPDGKVIEFGDTRFAGDRVTLSVSS